MVVVFYCVFQVIDGVEEGIIECVDFGFDVVWNGQVEQQYWFVLVCMQGFGDYFVMDYWFVCGGG